MNLIMAMVPIPHPVHGLRCSGKGEDNPCSCEAQKSSVIFVRPEKTFHPDQSQGTVLPII